MTPLAPSATKIMTGIMTGSRPKAALRLGGTLLVLLGLSFAGLSAVGVLAQESTPAGGKPAGQGSTAQGSQATTTAPTPDAPSIPKVGGQTIDQLVALVNGELVLDSDVDEERRFENFQPYLAPNGGYSRDRAIERLINRDLILQQSELQPGDAITDADVQKQIDELRKEIPACRQFHCETTQGWDRFLAEHGFTQASLNLRWRQRMQVLAFIEQRFRLGAKITPADIRTYYEKTMLPEYRKQNAPAPSLDVLSPRIQELLLQQQVSALLGDWLRSLRAQGGIVVLHPGEVAP